MRKHAALLKSTPAKLDRISKRHLADIAKRVPVPGCEEQWGRYLAATLAVEEACARYDAIHRQVEKEGGTSACPSYVAFEEAGEEYTRKANSAFGALDAYAYAAKHVNDVKMAAEDELRDIIGASLSDNLDGLGFSLNFGLLGAKVAQAIRNDVIEHEFESVPLCEDDKL